MKTFLFRVMSFFSALLLCFAALLGSLLIFGCSSSRFAAQQQRIGILPEEPAEAFARSTLGYLTGRQESWNVASVLKPYGLVPSEDFIRHMANVRKMVHAAGAILLLCLIFALPFLLISWFLRKGFSFAAWMAGLSLPLLLCLGVGFLCLTDFQGFWYFLHEHWIPDGIFSSAEPIMRLFPVSLFASYAAPIVICFLLMWGLLAAIGWIIRKHSLFQKERFLCSHA